MKQLVTNNLNGEIIAIDVQGIENKEIALPQEYAPTIEELTQAVADLTAKLNDKGLIP